MRSEQGERSKFICTTPTTIKVGSSARPGRQIHHTMYDTMQWIETWERSGLRNLRWTFLMLWAL